MTEDWAVRLIHFGRTGSPELTALLVSMPLDRKHTPARSQCSRAKSPHDLCESLARDPMPRGGLRQRRQRLWRLHDAIHSACPRLEDTGGMRAREGLPAKPSLPTGPTLRSKAALGKAIYAQAALRS